MNYTCVSDIGLQIQAQSNQFNSYSMFKAAFKEYVLIYILEYDKSRPNYYTDRLAQQVERRTREHNVSGYYWLWVRIPG